MSTFGAQLARPVAQVAEEWHTARDVIARYLSDRYGQPFVRAQIDAAGILGRLAQNEPPILLHLSENR
jgi:hypothetical protein